jgi:anthranilate phosphoribosyltransferase
VRKAIAKPTFFNLLGPLLSPVKVKRQIIGTSFVDKMELIAETAKLLGIERVLIVRGEDGLDEVTLTGKTRVIELKDGELDEYEIAPSDFEIEECVFDEIAGGDAEFNVSIAKSILSGECKTRHKDLVLANAALAMYLNGEGDLKESFNKIEI